MEKHLKEKYGDKVCIAWFTAWDPGGIGDLGDAMLHCFAHSFPKDNRDIGKALKELDEALGLRKSIKARAGQAFNMLSKVLPEGLKEVSATASATLEELDSPRRVQESYAAIVKWLKDNDRTAFFFVDDLDRSTGEQIFDLLSELKVYVSHPRIATVLTYDDCYVLEALKSSLPPGIDANKYLEKIVSFRKVLPHASQEHLRSMASRILRSSLGIEELESQRLGEFTSELCQCNPRRLKRLLLTYLNSLPKFKERGWRLATYNISALAVCAAAETGLLRNEALIDVFERGIEEEIIACLNDIGEKNSAEKPIVKLLADMVGFVSPNFAPNLVSFMRLVPNLGEHEGLEKTVAGEAPPPARDWKVAFAPILVRALKAGFRLNSDIAFSSGDVAFAPNPKLIDIKKFALSVTKDRRAQSALLRYKHLANDVSVFALRYPETNILIVVGSVMRLTGSSFLAEFDAELTLEKPFTLWIIEDESVESRIGMSYKSALARAKTRSASLKYPFTAAVTPPSKINVLLDFLIENATKKVS
jgi:hypothetical protein